MTDILIKSKIKNQDEEVTFEGRGIFDKKKNLIQYQDDHALLTIFLKENIMLRETTDAILSYKFKEKEKTSFEVFLKDLKQRGFVPLETFSIVKEKNSFEVVYQIDGNDFKHEFKVEWEVI